MKLSVIIPTYNRRDILTGYTLPSLAKQEIASEAFEIIVVDDGSTDGTREALAKFAREKPGINLRVLTQTNRGPAVARNRALEICKGEFVLVLGDDTFPADPDFLSRRVREHEDATDSRIAILGCTRWYPPVENGLMRWLDRCDLQFAYRSFGDGQFLAPWLAYTSNLSWSRKLVIEAGERFSERFSPRAMLEDAEFGYRLAQRHGLRLLYRKELLLYHHHIYHPRDYRERCRSGAIGKAELQEINPELYSTLFTRGKLVVRIRTVSGWIADQLPLAPVLALLSWMPAFVGRWFHGSLIAWDGLVLARNKAKG